MDQIDHKFSVHQAIMSVFRLPQGIVLDEAVYDHSSNYMCSQSSGCTILHVAPAAYSHSAGCLVRVQANAISQCGLITASIS